MILIVHEKRFVSSLCIFIFLSFIWSELLGGKQTSTKKVPRKTHSPLLGKSLLTTSLVVREYSHIHGVLNGP